MHPLVADAAKALDAAGVRWALLRGEHELADPRGDVDVLIDARRDLGTIERALCALGITAVPQVGAGAHRLVVGHHRPTRRWIEFDLEWDLDFGPQRHFMLNWLAPSLRTRATDAVLARRCRAPELPSLWVLHPDDAFWALLLHVIVDKQTVKDRHADRLVALAGGASEGGPLADVVAAACPPGWDVARIIRSTLDRDWPTLVALGRVLARRSCRGHPVVHRTTALGRGLRRLGRSVWPVLTDRGVVVAVDGGTDASRAALVAGLLAERRLDVRVVHVGHWRVAAWRGRAAARYHRLRGRTAVFDARPPARARRDVVVTFDAWAPLTRDGLADVVAAVWRARCGQDGSDDGAGRRTMRRMPGTSRAATTDCVAR